MTISIDYPSTKILYPDEDGKPMAEGDAQRDSLIYAVKALELYFHNRQDIYISGNMFIYYEQNNPEAVVAPDTFVIFGVDKKKRKSYKVWEENDKTPNFVLEITSKSTYTKDQGAKKGIYSFLQVQEYFQYDPTADYLKPQLQGWTLVAGNYVAIPAIALPNAQFSLRSEVLGLDLRLDSGEFRFFDPVKGEKLLTYEELNLAREEAQLLANQEKAANIAAQNRIAQLEAQLAELKAQQQQSEE